jgi:DNA-3-methyladenine glycosylase II
MVRWSYGRAFGPQPVAPVHRRSRPRYRPRMRPTRPPALDPDTLRSGVQVLAARDPDLAGIAARLGAPPLWDRPPGFETLVRIILEQQVSLRSGAAAAERLLAAAGALAPEPVLRAGEERLRIAGLTRQKARYLVALAGEVHSGVLDLEALATVDDDEVRTRLTRVVGIGRWTADIYLLMALLRPDVWPVGDLALAGAMRRAKGLERLPDAGEQARIAESWRPYRSVAARLLWHAYLAGER